MVSNGIKRYRQKKIPVTKRCTLVQFGETPNRSASAQALRLKDLNKQETRKEVVKTNNKTRKSSSKKEIRVNPRNLRLKKETGVKRCQMVSNGVKRCQMVSNGVMIKKIQVKNGNI